MACAADGATTMFGLGIDPLTAKGMEA